MIDWNLGTLFFFHLPYFVQHPLILHLSSTNETPSLLFAYYLVPLLFNVLYLNHTHDTWLGCWLTLFVSYCWIFLWENCLLGWSFALERDIYILLHCNLEFDWVLRNFQWCVTLVANSLLFINSHHIGVYISEKIVGILACMFT